MTILEKLADWLTGGKYSLRKDLNDMTLEAYKQEEEQCDRYHAALRTIASIPVTPSSNGQTRKAVRIAKEALLQ